MKLKIFAASLLLASNSLFALDFISYKDLTDKLKKEDRQNGNFANEKDVQEALKKDDWLVVDVRTVQEWLDAHIEGSVLIGRERPEAALEHFASKDGKITKPNLIVVCTSAARASIEAQAFRQMGFQKVMIYDIVSWYNKCNPVVNQQQTQTGLQSTVFYNEKCPQK